MIFDRVEEMMKVVMKSSTLRAALRAIFIVVFIAWIAMWVLEPAKISHESWQKYLKTKTNLNSTYFGGQGTNLLLYTFPIMFIATFSCLYLHLGKESETQIASRSNSSISSLRRPVLVKAPLGIVNTTELVFSALFVVLLIWSFFGYIILYPPWKKKLENKVGLIAYIVGCLGNVCLAFLFFPVTRGSSILPLVGLTSESSIKYHIWLGHISMVFFTLHSVGFIIYFALVHNMAKLLEWSRNSISNVAGEIVFVFCLLMWATSIARVRIKMFELFFYTHQLYALYIFFFVLHVGIAYSCMILPGIFLFLIDRYLRFLQSRHKAQVVSAHVLPCGAVELHVSKSPGLQYKPMSIMFINMPSISKLQWHPFTVTSDCNMETDKISILIKCEGNWSKALYKTLSLPSPVEQLCASVEGPYGPTSLPFLRYDSLVMVSGGSGIAAFIPIIKDIVYKSTTENYPTQQILLICAFKRAIDLSMLDLLLPTDTNNTPLDISNIKLKIQAYVTREEQELNDLTNKKLFHTIWFKHDPNIAPVTAILGQNGWLWLGAIISSSFTMFLLFLAILTQYYVYPIDRNTDEIYHFSGRALWDMFFICLCVAVTASFAFMWNKKQAMEELKQRKDINNATPKPIMSMISNSFNKFERELESLQHDQLIKKATMVHFGGRPNLKKILSNCEGTNVGVLVCGPREMRQEVAKLCSNGSTNNLHFEAISFNW